MQAHPVQDTIMFTLLEDYQKAIDKSTLQPLLVMKYFTELANTKGLVLSRGDVETSKLTTTEAQYLINQLQIYYSGDEKKYCIVQIFNHTPSQFDFNMVIGEFSDVNAKGSEH
jgi:hypothetical protein